MTRSEQQRPSTIIFSLAAAMLAGMFVLATFAAQAAQAQTLTVLHNFTDSGDEDFPVAGLTMDGAGNFYGTTHGGEGLGVGTVFRLSRGGSGWLQT